MNAISSSTAGLCRENLFSFVGRLTLRKKRGLFSHFVEATVKSFYCYCYKIMKVSMLWQVLPAERRSHKITLDIAGLG